MDPGDSGNPGISLNNPSVFLILSKLDIESLFSKMPIIVVYKKI